MRFAENMLLLACLAAMFVVLAGVFASPLFMRWEDKKVAMFYNENALGETGSSNAVSAIVWDFRGFDTFGEETVLFTAVAGLLAITAYKISGRRK
jgi:multisubunit Na+/H+ antiporter MnhB subunit